MSIFQKHPLIMKNCNPVMPFPTCNQIFPTTDLIIKGRLLIVQTPYIEIITKCNWYAPKLAIK